jgi:hypothetical protein
MTNLPAERSDATLALTGTQASLFDDDPARLLGLDDGEFAALVAQVRQRGDDLFTGIRKVVGLLAWAAWHRYDEKRYREFVADFAGRLGVESRVILDWRRKAATGLPMPPMAQARSDARKGAGQRPVNTSGRIIPAKSSEGSGPGMPQTRPGVAAPSAPPDPSEKFAVPEYVERPPSNRAMASRVVTAMQNVDPTDAGPVLTPEEATFLRQWAQRTLDAWKAKHVPPAPAEKPQRRQGTITRPADRAPKPPVKVNGAPVAGSLTRRTVEPMFKK